MNALTPRNDQSPALRPVLQPQTFDQLVRFAEMAAQSDLMPRDYKNKPANIMLAVQMGSELGLAPMQAVNSIAVINGRPGVWGDGMIGLCRQSPLCEDIQERFEGEGDNRTAICVATRRGSTPSTSRFSVADAKRAGLWGKQGPWQQYPDRMLQNRARGFALRDAFPDLLRGLKTVEELRDTPPEITQQVTSPEPKASSRPAPRTHEVVDAIPYLDDPAPAPVQRRSVRDVLRDTLASAQSRADVDAATRIPAVAKILNEGPEEQRRVLQSMLDEAYARLAEDADEGLDAPMPEVSEEAAAMISDLESAQDIGALMKIIQNAAFQAAVGRLDDHSRSALSTAVSAAKMGFARTAA